MNILKQMKRKGRRMILLLTAVVLASGIGVYFWQSDVNALTKKDYSKDTLFAKSSDNYTYIAIKGEKGISKIKVTISYDGSATASNFLTSSRTIKLTSSLSSSTNPYNLKLTTTSASTTKGGTGYYDQISFNCTYTLPAHNYAKDYTKDSVEGIAFSSNYSNGTHSTSSRTVTVNFKYNMYNLGIITYPEGSSVYRRWYGTSYQINLARNIYTIRFDANGGSCTTTSKVYKEGETIGELPIATKAHSKLVGWYIKDGSSRLRAEGTICSSNAVFNKSMTVYAKWTYNAYNVQFSANGGTGNMEAQIYDRDEEYELPANTFKREAFVFAGWSTSPAGFVQYTNRDTVSNLAVADGNVTLYAIWSKDGNFDISNVTDDTDMFRGCGLIVGGDGSKYDDSQVDSKRAHIDDSSSDPGYFTGR